MLAKAKRVIFLCMSGGPSHLETFDYKPKLDQMDGKPMPESFTKGQPICPAARSGLARPWSSNQVPQVRALRSDGERFSPPYGKDGR